VNFSRRAAGGLRAREVFEYGDAVSICTTHGIRVAVRSRFVHEESLPQHFVFTYTIKISNEGEAPAQLRRRHWFITDATGGVREVEGEGVVGSQPLLHPGESFEYSGGCVLETPHGAMHGSYMMLRPDGRCFEARIEPFVLAVPQAMN
jgi:ApaG protein